MKTIAVPAFFALFCGCTVGPNYRRPQIAVPDTFRVAASQQPPTDPASLGDLRWWDVFQDPELQPLLKAALANNYDLRIAAARVEQARANVGIVRADQLPEVGAGAGFSRTKSSGAAVPFLSNFSGVTNTLINVTPSVSWALDFWGQYRRASEAARANFLATEAGQEAVRVSIVAGVAAAYFQLLELDLELAITERTLATRRASLQLTRIREQGGVASLLEVRQAESLIATATAIIPQIQQQIEQTENLIATLLGENPRTIARGLPLDQQKIPATPPGVPSTLLTRRPDIRGAEQTLIAANAGIGVARAAYFPNVALTAYSGLQTRNLGDFVQKASWIWGLTPSLSVPIFTAGRIRSTVAFTEAQRDEAVLVYRQTIQQAFRDTSDALIATARTAEYRAQQETLTGTYRDAARLATVRYQGGVTTYLEVLDSERNVYAAELNLARALLGQLTAAVQLYSALGGGWQL